MSLIRLLIADDSVVSRQLLKNFLSEVPDFEVVAVASNGRIALDRIPQYNPDVVILDIEMPEMDGLEALQEIRRLHGQLPVIMFSAMTETGAAITVQALALGADDYVTKPSTKDRQSSEEVSEYLLDAFVPRIKALYQKNRPKLESLPPELLSVQRSAAFVKSQTKVNVVGIGVSTGGPNALSVLFEDLADDFPVPILLVQHMPPMFTKSLADRLDQTSRLKVLEAEDGMVLQAGYAYIAPGNYHMDLKRQDTQVTISLNQLSHENSCRPAVDVTFRAIAECYGPLSLGVIMTGMGKDGLRGCEYLSEVGGQILAQDEATSTIWGMPGFVVKAGLADKVLPLDHLAVEINRIVQFGRSA